MMHTGRSVFVDRFLDRPEILRRVSDEDAQVEVARLALYSAIQAALHLAVDYPAVAARLLNECDRAIPWEDKDDTWLANTAQLVDQTMMS